MEISNSSIEGVELQTIVHIVSELIATTTPIMYSKNLSLSGTAVISQGDWNLNLSVDRSWTLQQDQVVNKNLYINSSKLDLNGYVLTIKGDLVHSGGTLDVNGGQLIVKNDYLVSKADKAYGSGQLHMDQVEDRVLVEGDFFFNTTGYGFRSSAPHNYLSAGVLEIKGSFEQKAGDGYHYKNFYTQGTHRVVLSGASLQTVSFQRPGSNDSHFNILNLYNTSVDGVELVTKTSVTKLFDHQRNVFSLFDNSTANFVDYDADGIKDHLDSYPTIPLNSTADQDGDGIPDHIEIANGLNPLDSTDAHTDTDEDGYTNLEEYLAGTDINDSASIPMPDSPLVYPELNTFHSHLAVRLDNPRNDSSIYYTLDGTVPTLASALYSGAFLLESSATVNAIVIQASGQASPIATKDYSVLNKAVWTPIPGLSWQWQLQDDFDDSIKARVYDLDLFDTPAETIATLKATGHRVICYFNAGAWENWRDDASDFSEAVKGNALSGYADEKWLDIRDIEALKTVMQARLDLAVNKECDAVEPDNIDGYTNNTGFALTANDQIHYNLWLSNQANARGLSIGLKNDVGQISTLEPFFDWALNEQCLEFNECDTLQPFIAANKAVFGVEYLTADNIPDTSAVCITTDAKKYSWLIKKPELDSWVDSCADYREFIDADNDGVVDYEDNCLNIENINQRDTDNDGFGNRCDADLNNDGATNFADFASFRQHFFTASPDADLNGDGVVNFADFAIFRSLFNQQPGPAAGQ